MASFPTAPLPVTVGIAPGANPVDQTGWNFTDITTDVREAGAITIEPGRRDEGLAVDATDLRATIDNRTGNYSRTNPLGAYYGQLDKGTPLQVRVTRINDTFTRTTSNGWGVEPDSNMSWIVSSASTWSTNGSAGQVAIPAANAASRARLPDAAADDVEITHVASLSAVTTGAAWVHATLVRFTDDNNNYRAHLEFGLAGVVGVKISKLVGGALTDLTAVIPVGVTYSAGTRIRTRVRAIGPTIQIRAWLDGGSEPTVWHAQVDDDDLTGQQTGLYEWRVAGNTNVGTLTVTVDDFRMDAIRATTPVPEWPVRWDQSGNDVTSPVAGAGILRRLGTGQSALRSAMYRQLSQWSPTGFWPLEDGTGSTLLASAVAGGRLGSYVDVQLGTDGPPGAASSITLNNATSTIRGSTGVAPSTTGWAAMIAFKLSAPVGVDSTLVKWSSTGTVRQWQVVAAAGGSVKLFGFAADGSTIVSSGPIGWGTTDPTQWSAIELQLTVSGGTVSTNLYWLQVSELIISSFAAGGYAGTPGRPSDFTATGAAGTAYSMSWLGPQTLPFGTLQFISTFAGWAGETAGARLVRLSAEEGVPLRVFGDPSNTALMGAQTPATYLDLVRECEQADQGMLIETGAGLGYLTRVSRYNPSAVMTLDFDQGHIALPPQPTDDDQRLRNRIALSRTGGASATVSDPASITKSGEYSDELTVNLYSDGDLVDHASWRLGMGTVDELRWPRIPLALHRNPTLIKDWCKVRPGSRITIANPPDQVGVTTLDLIVEGWTETLDIWTWDVELVCSPASPWLVGTYDSTARYDSASTTLESSVNSSARLLGFTTGQVGDVWWWQSYPYSILVGGEQMSVLTMTQPSSVAVVDGGFETGSVGTWSPTGGSLAATTAQANRGSWSALFTVSGSPANALVRDHTTVSASPGQTFTTKMWVRCSASRNVLALIDFYNGASYLSSAFTSFPVTANTWTEITASGTAPASTTRLEYGPTMDSSPANGTLLYIDDIDILRTDVVSNRQVATVTRSVNGIVKSQIAGTEVHVATPGRWAL